MSRIFKVLSLISIIVVSVGLSIKLLAEWRARDLLNDALLRIALWTEASWQSVELSVPGNRIVVNGLEIRPRNQPGDPVKIQSLSVQVDDPLYLVSHLLGIAQRQFPAVGFVKFSGLSLPADSPWLTRITDYLNHELGPKISPSCGDVLFVGPREYREMGYAEIFADFAIDYELDRDLKSLSVSLSGQVANISAGKLLVELDDIPGLHAQGLPAEPPRLSRLTFTYRNRGYIQTLLKYCAKRQGLTLAAYINQVVNREDDYYGVMWGIVPGDAIRQAYAQFLENPDTVEVSMAPREDFDLAHLSMYSAKDWPAMLRMQLRFNGQRVSPLVFSLPDHDLLSTVFARAGFVDMGSEPPRVDSEPELSETPSPPVIQYMALDLDKLDGYVGREIRLQKLDAESVDGVLVAVDPRKIRIRQKMYGGEVTLPVKREQLVSVAVKIVQ